MKTTLELPDNLVREIKIRAVHEGRKLKDLMAELLRTGLAAKASRRQPAPRNRSELPVVKCRHAATPAREMTPERVAGILQDQEALWHAKTGR